MKSSMKVSQLMTPDPACATPETSLEEVARMMLEHDCGEIPICESRTSRRLAGVVTDRDITIRAVARGRNPLELHARDVLSSPVVTVSRETDLDECCRIMEQEKVRRLPVVDDRGHCIGIVSQADIARRAPERATAEVVRDVSQPAHAQA